ncbi:matrix metalloproteinase-28 [Platysternon megacephalum]|uniref:Matrix metalloproteinase-28 n=1 Tax=Platysternon megacephalum TaxID=55544 RepID=A0A4D9ER82_9SAUR|nr:matrix metalloproteinase-28 [Platysternon megacephalum]
MPVLQWTDPLPQGWTQQKPLLTKREPHSQVFVTRSSNLFIVWKTKQWKRTVYHVLVY